MSRLQSALLVLAACATFAPAAQADPADYVFVPYTTPGTRLLAYGAGFARARDGGSESQHTLAVGWAPASRWFTALYAGWAAEDGSGPRFDEWSWLNHLQLTTPGAWPADLGVLCEVERPRDRAQGTGLVCGPTLQVDTDRVQLNFNPLLEKHLGAEDAEPASLRYQWQLEALLGRGVELGAQGFGELGPWNHWAPGSRQSHVLGPALVVKWTMPDGRPLQLDTAALFGLGAGSPRTVLRLRLSREF